jgi:hypothetical protein
MLGDCVNVLLVLKDVALDEDAIVPSAQLNQLCDLIIRVEVTCE